MVTPLWFDKPQFPPSIIKKKGPVKMNLTVDGYEVIRLIQKTVKKVYHLLQSREKSQIWRTSRTRNF